MASDAGAPDALPRALELLAGAAEPNDRLAALALALDGSPGADPALDGELARCFARGGHLVARGGASALLRHALSYPEGSPVRTLAEAAARAPGAPPAHLVRRASTLPFDDGLLRVIETGGSNAGGVQLSPDGARLYTFVWGSTSWLDGDGYSRFQIWSTVTGELLCEQRAGQFREESGSFAVSPDERTVAVRSHREIELLDLDVTASPPRLRRRCVLPGSEGPYMITFLDERRLVADDSSLELVLWDTVTAQRLAAAPSAGWHAHVPVADNTRLLVAGCVMSLGRMICGHALPSLVSDGCFAAPTAQRARSEAIAVSPAERLVATGDDQCAVALWPLAELRDPAATSSVRAPLPVAVQLLTAHPARVSALRFVAEDRLLSGDWHGGVYDWDLAHPERAPRPLFGHSACLTGIAVHPRGHLAATAAEDGLVILWDLRGPGQRPPRPIPPARSGGELRRHPDGVEVVTDGVARVVPLPAGLHLSAAVAQQDPELIGINLGDDLIVVPIDEPGPPQLQLRRGTADASQLLDTVDLDDHATGLCALDERTLVVGMRGHLDFYQLR